MKITVVIPSIGRPAELLASCKDLSLQDADSWECIIVLQGEPAGNVISEIMRTLGDRARIYHCNTANANLARNIGLAEARGEVLVYLDDDVSIPSRGFLEAHCSALTTSGAPAVLGQIRGPGQRSRKRRHHFSYSKTYGWMYFPWNYRGPARVRAGASANISVLKAKARAIGGWDWRFDRGGHREDGDFCYRLCDRFGMLGFSPEPYVVHYQAPTGGSRSWRRVGGGVPEQHAYGEFYFVLTHLVQGRIGLLEILHHMASIARAHWGGLPDDLSAQALGQAVRGVSSAVRRAWQSVKAGPLLLPHLSPDVYTRLA